MNDVFGQVTTILSLARVNRTMRAVGNSTYRQAGRHDQAADAIGGNGGSDKVCIELALVSSI